MRRMKNLRAVREGIRAGRGAIQFTGAGVADITPVRRRPGARVGRTMDQLWILDVTVERAGFEPEFVVTPIRFLRRRRRRRQRGRGAQPIRTNAPAGGGSVGEANDPVGV